MLNAFGLGFALLLGPLLGAKLIQNPSKFGPQGSQDDFCFGRDDFLYNNALRILFQRFGPQDGAQEDPEVVSKRIFFRINF